MLTSFSVLNVSVPPPTYTVLGVMQEIPPTPAATLNWCEKCSDRKSEDRLSR